MTDVLSFKKANCKNCHKCIRVCPVKSIRFLDSQARILPDECVLCGQCVVTCPQNAKQVRNDLTEVIGAIGEGRRVIASVAPSFISNFEARTIEQFEQMLCQLGFFAARETAEGAYLVKRTFEQMIREGKQRTIVSSCCPTVVMLAQKYYPTALPAIAPVISPMLASGRQIKQEFPDAYVVFIGPCISKKQEAQKLPGYIDCVLTFEELSHWMEERRVTIPQMQTELDTGRRSRLFPRTGGIIDCMDTEDTSYQYLMVDGMANCMRALEEIGEGGLDGCFIEMSACAGSCLQGPGSVQHEMPFLYASECANRYARGTDGHTDFDLSPSFSLTRPIPAQLVHNPRPSEHQVEEVLARMGKTRPEHELNCGGCGYATCRDKARAVCNGKADVTMCLPHLLEQAESFSNNIFLLSPDGIVVLDDQLCIQRMNASARRMFVLPIERNMFGQPIVELMDPTLFQQVLETGNDVIDRRVGLEPQGRYVDLTIVLDSEHGLVFGIFKDITSEYLRQEKARETRSKMIDITDKVVEKQMRIVQEIASLLGETTAETKIALSQIKNTVLLEDDEG